MDRFIGLPRRSDCAEDWKAFRAAARSSRAGRLLALGRPFRGGDGPRVLYEQVRREVADPAKVEVATGAAAMGQSTKTMIAQIVAEQFRPARDGPCRRDGGRFLEK